MQRKLQFMVLALSGLSFILPPTSDAAGKLYRWTDSAGNTHYSDRLPPEEADKARTLLNDRGIRVESVGSARTPEQIARDKELERMRAARQRLIEEQQAADRVLLRTFRSEDDIRMTLDGKLAAINVQIQVIRGNIKRLKQKLAQMQKDAASLERRGQQISDRFLKAIGNTRQALKDSYAAIVRNEKLKQEYQTSYKKDLERFRKLKNLRGDQQQMQIHRRRSLVLDRLFLCNDEQACNRAWKRAESFVQEFATTPIQMLSDTIIMTTPPVKSSDIGITVARLRGKPGDSPDDADQRTRLFLDIQCKSSPRGMELCASERLDKLRAYFKSYLAETTDAGGVTGENKPSSRTAH